MNAKNTTPQTLMAAVRYFSDLDVAQDFFTRMRWPNGEVRCPRCGGADVSYQAKYRRWQCKGKHDRKQFTVKVGTVMEDSPMGLDKWAVAFWLEVNAKNSISSYEVHRALGITQKSAWFMQHRIRLALQSKSGGKLGGSGRVVEADETFIGGKAFNMHKATRARRIGKGTGSFGKAVVMGLLERHGPDSHSKVRTQVIGAANRETMHPIVRQNVEAGTQLNTDAHPGYGMLGADFIHRFIDHAETYVKGTVHTNGLENYWSLVKRMIKGTHIAVEPFHLFRYLDAQAFRYNNRKATDGERMLLATEGMTGKRLTYKALIGEASRALPPEMA